MPGQAYVAFSRVRTLEGLHLLGFDNNAIRANQSVVDEMNRLHSCLMYAPTEAPTAVENGLNLRLLNVRSYLEHLKAENAGTRDIFCFVEMYLHNSQELKDSQYIVPDSICFREDRTSDAGAS